MTRFDFNWVISTRSPSAATTTTPEKRQKSVAGVIYDFCAEASRRAGFAYESFASWKTLSFSDLIKSSLTRVLRGKNDSRSCWKNSVVTIFLWTEKLIRNLWHFHISTRTGSRTNPRKSTSWGVVLELLWFPTWRSPVATSRSLLRKWKSLRFDKFAMKVCQTFLLVLVVE